MGLSGAEEVEVAILMRIAGDVVLCSNAAVIFASYEREPTYRVEAILAR